TTNMPYTGTVPVSGGTAPYVCNLTGGSLPAGLTLGANCQITGTPTAAGSTSATVTATDSSNPRNTGSGPITVTIKQGTTTLRFGTLATATVNSPYTATVPVAGGTGPYTCTQTGGTLPAGLLLNTNCQVTGTPTTASTTTVSVRATDTANPGSTGTGNVAITVNAATATLTFGTPAAGTVNVPYTGMVPVSGGTAPYTCQQVGGTLPAGLTLAGNCAITGTPTVAGTTYVSVKATDSANPTATATANIPVTINATGPTLNLGTPANATVNLPYTGTIPVSGGTAPYVCAQAGGTLPAGLALNSNCQITGTPTVPGTTTVTVNVADAANPANTATKDVPVTVNPAGALLTFGNPPAATVNAPYTGMVPVAGGTAPYTCTLAGGTLPAGLLINSNCQVAGTPTVVGSSTVSVSAADSSNPSITSTGNVTVTVDPAPVTLTISNPPVATVNTPYSGTVPVAGGTAPYVCTLASGTLPAGLTLGNGCTLTGTPTAVGTTTVGITVTDGANPTDTNTLPVVITVQPVPALTFSGSLPNGVVNQAYAQTLQAQGGVGPYTYALTSGQLPAGLTMSPAGFISGTPAAVGASSFTVTATDSEGTPQTASLPLILLITYPQTPTNALLNGPYAFLFQGYDDVVVGVLAYQTATVGSFTADGAGAVNSGELDSNHQGSNPAGNTVASQNFLGSYTLGADLRGSLTITRLNTDGSAAGTTTYALALKAPVAPATTVSTGALIEYDGNQTAGTKGTGTLLQQAPAAFASGLTGSYAYGVLGDTPCLPACTAGLSAGPVAGVGQFNAVGGAVTAGTADTNVAAANFSNSNLSGTYGAADGNGRVQLALNTSRLSGTAYPTDYAVYLVDANNALVMSTDKHSAFILQAGSARRQTQATFDSTSLAAPFVGYENAAVNPGLVGQTLQNVLNLSTATVFRGTGNADGTCNTTNVDVGGTTGLVNTLTGLGGSVPVGTVSALLGTYATTGNSTCAVQGNGRAVFNYHAPSGLLATTIALLGLGGTTPAPRVVYLTSPDAGYFLETGYAALGTLEAQTGQPFSLQTLNGTFVYSTVPASTLATVNSSGVFAADGQGHATSTLDENVGIGTLNVLQLGIAGSANYFLTDAIAGRYLLGTSRVIYAIVPGRFVLLEADAVSTTPYIALLF
ncbi:MAG: beta strand repeat-containing protein, partial [Janthinobacterium lividum]